MNPEFETLAVRGKTTIKGDLQVDGDFALGDDVVIADTLTVQGATGLNDTLTVAGATRIDDTTASTSTTSGALRVAGGVGVQGAVNIGGGMTVTPNPTVATNNVAIGPNAGFALQSTAANNICIGSGAGDGIQTGIRNVAIGGNALGAASTGGSLTGVVAIGTDAARLAASGQLIAIGLQTLYSATAGGQNTAIGWRCLEATTGTRNTVIGDSCFITATGSDNTALGTSCGTSMGAGNSNTFIGALSASALTVAGGTSAQNAFLGSETGRFIGSGSTGCTNINNSVLIGHDARPAADTQTNQIVIGHQGRGNGSDTTTLGNSATTGTFIPGGNLTLSNGNLILGTSGNGIDFSADGNAAGMTSELLDDYEEGTFTPAIGGVTSPTYTTRTGWYTKIGRVVYFNIVIDLSAGTASGNLTFSGLPFTNSNDATLREGGAWWIYTSAFASGPAALPTMIVLPNNTVVSAYDTNGTNYAATSLTDVLGIMRICGMYIAA